MEASGLITKRLRYALGMTNGRALWGEDNDTKDFHGKVALKLGGMAFDGSSTGDIFGPSGNNWAEKSVIFSLFGYSGSRLHDNDSVICLIKK